MTGSSRRQILQAGGIGIATTLAGCIQVTSPPKRDNVIGVAVDNLRDESVSLTIQAMDEQDTLVWQETQTIPPGEGFERAGVLPEGTYQFHITEAGDEGSPYELDIELQGCPENDLHIELKTVQAGGSAPRDVIGVSKRNRC